MARARAVSVDLTGRLESARAVELAAETSEQSSRAVYASTTLVLAALDVGWRQHELAPHLGISAGTLSKRVNDARRTGRIHPFGLTVDQPIVERAPLAEFAAPTM